MNYQAVIFDMDGTVLNTADDLTGAINYALARTGHRHDFSINEVKCLFGSGIRVALSRALALESGADIARILLIGSEREEELFREIGEPDQKEINRILEIYRPYYEKHCNEKTAPYPGVPEMLGMLQKCGIGTAVVSNKPDEAVQILAQEQFHGGFAFAAGEKEGTPRKPSPEMVLQILARMNVKPSHALYVGDSEIDVLTAGRAGMDCAAVTWGFRTREFLNKYHPAMLVDTCDELMERVIGEAR